MTPCILHTGCTTANGYGKVRRGGRSWLAHRWVVFQRDGQLDDKAVVRHTCDVRRCINPEHLVVGTTSDNMIDKSLRSPRGRTLKLTAEQVLLARADMAAGTSPQIVADNYGVTYENMLMIRDRKTWRHL